MSLKGFIQCGHLPTLISSFLYFDIHFMVWILIGALGVYISQDFGLSPSQKGLMVAIPILGGSILRVPVGLLVDRLGPKKMGIIAQIVLLLPLLWGWLGANSFNQILAVGLFMGIAGASFAVALPMVSRWYPQEYQGLAMGIAGAGNSGTVLAALLAPRLAEVVGWHNVFGLAILPVLLNLGIYLVFAKDSPEQPEPKPLREYLTILREADTWWFCLFYSVTFGGFVGLSSFLGIFFHDQYGLSRVMAGNFTGACVVAGSLSRPLGGYLADRFGGIKMLTLLYSLISTFTFLVGLIPPLPLTTLLLFLCLAGLGMGNGSVFQLVPQRFRSEIGVITGIVGAVGGLGGFFLPSILGFFKQLVGSYGMGFLIFGLLSLLCLISLQLLRLQWSTTWLSSAGYVSKFKLADSEL